jgi:hypothetical protein
MSAPLYRLVRVELAKDLRGNPMRLLVFEPQKSEPFGKENDHPQGSISQVVTDEYAKKFTLGDDYSVSFRERES